MNNQNQRNMALQEALQHMFNNDYQGTEVFINEVIIPVFGNDIHRINLDYAQDDEYHEKAEKAGIQNLIHVAQISDERYNSNDISFFDVTLKDNVNVERARVNIQQLIRSIVARFSHILIVFHYEDVANRPWRFSYAYKQSTITSATSAKRYTYVFGRDFRGRTAAERFEGLKDSQHTDEDFEKAFSVQALSDEFFDRYRNIYADFVQYITGKRYEKIKNKWVEVKKEDPNTEIFSQFKNDDKRVRDYIKKMLGRLTFLCFLQRKGWMNNDRNFLQNLYQTSPQQTDFLDAVLEPLFFGVLNTPLEKRKEVFIRNGWNTGLADEWKDIPYLNGGLFEQTTEDKLTDKFPKRLFHELFKFLGEYNFTIDENDPDDAEIGIDPEMLGRIFESLLEDNKDKGAFYTPKEIVQYMCRQSIIEFLKTHTSVSLHSDVEDLINKGLVNHSLQNRENAREIHKLLKEVTVCDPAIGSGAFPMGILNILFTARQHLYGFLEDSEPFNPLEIKKAIIRDNIYGVDIEQGAVDIARLRFWLAILVEEQVATPLPNLDYRIVRGNSLITTFNNEYIKLPETPDGRTKLAKLKKELYKLQNDLFDLNGDEKFQREIEIKCKILEIIKVQLGIDKATAQEKSRIESDIFEDKKLSKKALDKAKQAHAIEQIKNKSLFTLNNLITSLTTPAISLSDRAQIDIKFFDWKIIFSNIFRDDTNSSGFDIVIGNPPYNEIRDLKGEEQLANKASKYFEYAQGGRVNLFQFFYPLAIDILRTKGICSFITQNSLLAEDSALNNRNLIWGTSRIIKVDSFPERDDINKRVFKSAKMSVCICLIEKISNKIEQLPSYIFPVNIWQDKNMKEGKILIINKAEIEDIYPEDKIIPLCDNQRWELLVKIKRQGTISIKAQAGEIDMTKYRQYFSDDSSFLRVITGAQVQRFYITDNPSQGQILYINPNILTLSSERIAAISDYRIVMQRITGVDSKIRLISTIIPNNILCSNSTNYISPCKNNINLYELLGLLNSKLMNFYIKQTSSNTNVTAKEISGFPIKSITLHKDYFVEMVNCLLTQSPKFDTLESENQIDNIVYHLYDLTYDEVLIIDPETPITREQYEKYNF